jgi:hypothetical protein
MHIHLPVPLPHVTSLALERELGLAVRSHSTPCLLINSLAIVTDRVGLPGLVESLKVESVEAPVNQSAEALLVEIFGVVETALCFGVVGSVCCIASLAPIVQTREGKRERKCKE